MKLRYMYIICIIIIIFCFSSCRNIINNETDSEEISPSESVVETDSEGESLVALSAIKDVIQNNKEYICTETGKYIYLKDFHSDNYLIINDKGFYEYTSDNDEDEKYVFSHFCVIDIDGDGNSEILLESTLSNIFLFHYESGIVYGYVFPYRGMLNLKEDGSFGISGGAASYLVGNITFSDGKCIFNELCCSDELNEKKPIYRINGNTAERKDVEEYFKKEEEKENAKWYTYDEF